jgi:hypothetical protein
MRLHEDHCTITGANPADVASKFESLFRVLFFTLYIRRSAVLSIGFVCIKQGQADSRETLEDSIQTAAELLEFRAKTSITRQTH